MEKSDYPKPNLDLASTVPRGDVGFYTREPRTIVCQFCSEEVVTAVSYQVGLGNHACAGGICLTGLVNLFYSTEFFTYV